MEKHSKGVSGKYLHDLKNKQRGKIKYVIENILYVPLFGRFFFKEWGVFLLLHTLQSDNQSWTL